MQFEKLGRFLDRALGQIQRQISQSEILSNATFQSDREDLRSEPMTHSPTATYEQFKNLLIENAPSKSYPRKTPELINLGPLHPYIAKLWSFTEQYGIEYGRGILVDVRTRQITLSQARPGTQSGCVIEIKIPQTGFHFAPLLMHTHPLDRTKRAPDNTRLHFSDEDFVTLLVNRGTMAEIVVSGPDIALVMKSSSTPCTFSEDQLRRRINDSLQERVRGWESYSRETWDFTRLIALEFGCSLYRNSLARPSMLQKVQVA